MASNATQSSVRLSPLLHTSLSVDRSVPLRFFPNGHWQLVMHLQW